MDRLNALRCPGKMGLTITMRHDEIKFVVAREFKQAGFELSIDMSGGLLEKRRPGDVQVDDWFVINK